VKSIPLAAAAVLLPLAASAALILPTKNMACLPQAQQEEIRAKTEEIVIDAQKRRSALVSIGPGYRVDDARRTRDNAQADLAACQETAKARKRGPEFCDREVVILREAQKRFDDIDTGTRTAIAIDTELQDKLLALRTAYPACTGAVATGDNSTASRP
jgi:hypothetical protein